MVVEVFLASGLACREILVGVPPSLHRMDCIQLLVCNLSPLLLFHEYLMCSIFMHQVSNWMADPRSTAGYLVLSHVPYW